MGIFDFFTKNKKVKNESKKRFYATPSLYPSELEKNEILSLIHNAPIDSHIRAIRYQARNIATSSALINGYFDTLDKEIFGDNGIILDLHTQDSKLNTDIENKWWAWREHIPYCALDFWDIESLSLLYLKRDGECFIYINETKEGLSLKVIDPDNVDESIDNPAQNIHKGIAFDEQDMPIAYFITDSNGQSQKIPSSHILHFFKRVSISQARGLSSLSSVIYPNFQKDKFKSAELKRARLQSEITGFFIPNEREVIPSFDNGEEQGEAQKEIMSVAEVGKMTYINDDIKPYFTESHNATNIEFFIKQTDKEIAKALGISYSTLTGDLNEVNYSSIRHGSSEQRRQFRGLQNFIIRNLHNKVFEAWVKNEIKRGNIAIKDYHTILEGYTFKPQGWEYIDPYKETNANKIALESGQKTLSEILREKGKELDSHIQELIKENEVYDILSKRKKGK
ncbi:phage portal protein [Helicobacter sp. MIT 05-5293]|uniref:phage portal protein n=1 Tax=Helicobacter sp. MIT 05-5293 TaxID=1548149 RepID=UPI00051CD110|nr:phage portal protein [Helicobacter sp. MIT 05-5293]TLD80168.1 phage portal protein [Helicobacter sp. MIT 05-5293]